jgi:hypothetical protein
MKHALLGTVLILYAILATPCYFEPSDLIISTAYIATLYSMLGDIAYPIAVMWAATGYAALFIGLSLIGHSLTKYIPFLRRYHGMTSYIVHHPVKVSLIIFIVSAGLAYIIMINTGLI